MENNESCDSFKLQFIIRQITMIKILLEIKVKNHEDLVKNNVGFFGVLVSKFINLEDRVEERVRQETLERIIPEVKKNLTLEGVDADVFASAYIEKRSAYIDKHK